MTTTYENRRRYEDKSVLCRICDDENGAIDDLSTLVDDGDEDEYDGTLVVHRDPLQRVTRVEIIDLLQAAKERIEEGRDPPIRSLHHEASFGVYGRVPA